LVTAFAGEMCRGEELFEGYAGLFHGVGIDQLGEIEVGTHIGLISHDAAEMAEVALQGV
jgi:hypothetical protein